MESLLRLPAVRSIAVTRRTDTKQNITLRAGPEQLVSRRVAWTRALGLKSGNGWFPRNLRLSAN